MIYILPGSNDIYFTGFVTAWNNIANERALIAYYKVQSIQYSKLLKAELIHVIDDNV